MAKIEGPNYIYRGLQYRIKKMGRSGHNYFIVSRNGAHVANTMTRPHAKTMARLHADKLLGLEPNLLPK